MNFIINKPAFRLGAVLLVAGVFMTATSAFFWDSEPEPSMYEIYIQSQEASNAGAEALIKALNNEFDLAAKIHAEQAKEFYSENLEENADLKTAWNDRKGDLNRIKELSGRELVELLQWAMYEKSKEIEERGKLTAEESLLPEMP